MKIFIAGDKYFRPDIIMEKLKTILEKAPEEVVFDSVKLPYPIDYITLMDDYIVPTGMAWDQNMDDDYGKQGVREYYGHNDTLKGLLNDCDVLIIHGAALPASRIDEAKKLKLICCMRGGPVNIDLEYAKSRGILVTNSPGKNAQGVAEYTVGLALAHIRHITESSVGLAQNKYLQKFGDYDLLGFELQGKSFGLVGFGQIAQKLCKILRGFGCKVYAYDPFIESDKMLQLGVIPSKMEELLHNSDIVSLHARGKKTIIGSKEFSMMKPGALFINTARGMLVDYKALKEALEEGKIAGAALDVFGTEPYAFYRELAAMPNVTATSHMAGISRETVLRGIEMTGGEILRYIEGEKLRYEL